MTFAAILIAATAIVLIIAAIMINNALVRRKNKVHEAFSSIDVYFEKRSDLIPQLVSTVKQQSKYEAETLQSITKLRSSIIDSEKGSEQQIGLQQQMTQMLGKLQLTAEDYPELRANEAYLKLQSELSKIETDLSAARRFYNSAVNAYNNALEEFPSNLIAGLKGYKSKTFFKTDKKADLDIKALFND